MKEKFIELLAENGINAEMGCDACQIRLYHALGKGAMRSGISGSSNLRAI